MRGYVRALERHSAPARLSRMQADKTAGELTRGADPAPVRPPLAVQSSGHDLSRVPVSPAVGMMPPAQTPVRVTQQSGLKIARDKDKSVLEKEGKTDKTTVDDAAEVRRIVVTTLSDSNSQLFPYVKDQLGKLKSDKTSYNIEDPAVFASKYRTYAKKRKIHIDPSIKDEDLVKDIGGFYDPSARAIYLKTRSTYCHAFHETIHSLSNPDVLATFLGHDLMEGLTQYFTDVVFKEQLKDVCHTHNYGDQLKCATRLVDAMHFDVMARLFFRSEVSLLPSIATQVGVKDTAALQALSSADICARLSRSQ